MAAINGNALFIQRTSRRDNVEPRVFAAQGPKMVRGRVPSEPQQQLEIRPDIHPCH